MSRNEAAEHLRLLRTLLSARLVQSIGDEEESRMIKNQIDALNIAIESLLSYVVINYACR